MASEDGRIQKKSVEKWKSHNGLKEPMRYNYKLNEASMVIDLGGYSGTWSRNIIEKYNCNVHIFEPFPRWYKHCTDLFKENHKVKVFQQGASNKNELAQLFDGGQGASLHLTAPNSEKIQLIDFAEYISTIEKVDLLKINIEGEEYAVLDTLYKNNMLTRIDNIQIQTHPFVKKARAKYMKMDYQLNTTHKKTYFYPWIWENWKLR